MVVSPDFGRSSGSARRQGHRGWYPSQVRWHRRRPRSTAFRLPGQIPFQGNQGHFDAHKRRGIAQFRGQIFMGRKFGRESRSPPGLIAPGGNLATNAARGPSAPSGRARPRTPRPPTPPGAAPARTARRSTSRPRSRLAPRTQPHPSMASGRDAAARPHRARAGRRRPATRSVARYRCISSDVKPGAVQNRPSSCQDPAR